MSNQQHTPEPAALIHAAWLEKSLTIGAQEAAAELRRLHAVEKQRDELLAALELCIPELHGWMNCHGEDIGTIAAIKAGKAAIASVKPDHFRDATKMMPGGADAPADIDDGFVGRIDDAITEALGDAMDCTRVWAAWGYGTMGQDDFVRVADDPGRVMEIRDAVLRVVRATEKGGAS